MKENRTREERLWRKSESVKPEQDSQIATQAQTKPEGYRYPRSRWSAPAE